MRSVEQCIGGEGLNIPGTGEEAPLPINFGGVSTVERRHDGIYTRMPKTTGEYGHGLGSAYVRRSRGRERGFKVTWTVV